MYFVFNNWHNLTGRTCRAESVWQKPGFKFGNKLKTVNIHSKKMSRHIITRFQNRRAKHRKTEKPPSNEHQAGKKSSTTSASSDQSPKIHGEQTVTKFESSSANAIRPNPVWNLKWVPMKTIYQEKFFKFY